MLSDIEPNLNVLGFVFFSTLFTYNFQRLLKVAYKINLKGERVKWLKINLKGVVFITVISLIGSVFYLLAFYQKISWILLLAGFLSFFYVVKVPWLTQKNLRDIPTIKIFIITVVWILIGNVVPVIVANKVFSFKIILILISNFLFMIAITIPFDIRDLKLDAKAIKTIPQWLGENKSKNLSLYIYFLSQILLVFIAYELVFGLTIFIGLGIVLLLKVKQNNKEMYFSGAIDGLLILQYVLLLINNYVN